MEEDRLVDLQGATRCRVRCDRKCQALRVPQMVEGFAQIGLGQWFRYFTGGLEIIGAIAILVPTASAFGGLLLLGISAGACLVQLFVFHGDVVHTIVLGALSAIVVWAHHDRIVVGLDRLLLSPVSRP